MIFTFNYLLKIIITTVINKTATTITTTVPIIMSEIDLNNFYTKISDIQSSRHSFKI